MFEKQGPLGTLRLPLRFGRYFEVDGGPYLARPKSNTLGVKLAPEVPGTAEYVIPIPDFSVPLRRDVDSILYPLVWDILHGTRVYVGCMGGIGRTGTVLGVLAKTFGVDHPVEYVRQHYLAHAMERKIQERFVVDYPVSDAVQNLIARSWWRALSFRKCLTNQT